MLNVLFFKVIAGVCNGSSFLGFPTWYKYLEVQSVPIPDSLGTGSTCHVYINGFNDIWLIVAAVIEILLRLAVLVAVGFVIYGGIKYVTSQGEPDKMHEALKTIIDALVGLVIAIAASALIAFVAGKIH
ncbi:MAG TPA: hypothetical protein VLF87_02455 [Patescibacteria group bacterium]|nr:hypothetical protein [Candidatus Saccharimonadales bacterium]HSX46824.1 hypothetical protein [Patescibacteria group bacterium]